MKNHITETQDKIIVNVNNRSVVDVSFIYEEIISLLLKQNKKIVVKYNDKVVEFGKDLNDNIYYIIDNVIVNVKSFKDIFKLIESIIK